MKLRELCTKFQHSVIFMFKIVLYAAMLATFFLMFSIDNPEITSLSRTAAVTLSTRTDNGTDIGRGGAETSCHLAQHLCGNMQDGSAPPGMYRSNGTSDGVVKQDGNAVGCAGSNGYAGHIGYQGINPL